MDPIEIRLGDLWGNPTREEARPEILIRDELIGP
jgi:hypothetical protein